MGFFKHLGSFCQLESQRKGYSIKNGMDERGVPFTFELHPPRLNPSIVNDVNQPYWFFVGYRLILPNLTSHLCIIRGRKLEGNLRKE